MSLLLEAKENLGEVLMMGFSGLELAPPTQEFLGSAKIGGIILFTQNYESPGQLAELTNQLQDSRASGRAPLWISADQEGGRVQRFRKPFTKIPDAQTVGLTDSPALAFELSQLVARELRVVGINVNFCPVADINTNPKNPVIGARAYGATEDLVSKMVSAVVRGHLVEGVQPCVKHFPGHGDTVTDSHFALPKIETDLDLLRERELKPFAKAFKSKCAMVMTAHVINSRLDPDFPSTLSRPALQGLLREELGFEGLIFSDDMEMKAISQHFGAEEAPRLALQAGCDVLIYRSEASTRLAYEALMRALETGTLAPEVILAAARRSQKLKRECLSGYQPVVIGEISQRIGIAEHLAVVQKIESHLCNK